MLQDENLTLKERVLKYLKNRKQRLEEGKLNSIPSPFKKFREDFLGIEQKKYYVVTSSTKGAKTQFTSYVFVYTPLLYAYLYPDKIRVKIFYYALEETPEDVIIRFMSFLLNYISAGTVRISPKDLKSSDNAKPVSQSILDLLDSEEYDNMIKFFEQNVIFSSTSNPTGMYNECRKYAQEHGITYTKKMTIKDEFGNKKTVEVFDWYEAEDPDEYKIIIYDHVSLITTERGLTLKQSIDKLSEYCVLLRNRYGFSPVVIQQQAFIGESLEAFKEKKIRPTIANLSDSKYPSRDCDICLGLFSPLKHELSEYLGYNIKVFKDNIRFLEVLINRGGQQGGITGLFFNGEVCEFKELPNPVDEQRINEVYNYLNKLRNKN